MQYPKNIKKLLGDEKFRTEIENAKPLDYLDKLKTFPTAVKMRFICKYADNQQIHGVAEALTIAEDFHGLAKLKWYLKKNRRAVRSKYL